MKRVFLPLLLAVAGLSAGCATGRPDVCTTCNREAAAHAVYAVSWDNTCADYPVSYRSDWSEARVVAPAPAAVDPAAEGGVP